MRVRVGVGVGIRVGIRVGFGVRVSFMAITCLLAEAIASMSEDGENPMAVGGEERHGTVAVSWKLSRLKTRTCRAASKAASHCHCK